MREKWNAFVSGKLANVNKQNMSELVSCFLSRIMRLSKLYYQDNFVISINLLTSKVLAKLFSLLTHVSYVVFLKVRDYIYFKLSFIKLFTCFVCIPLGNFTVCVFVLCWVHFNNPLSLPTPPHQLLGITKFFVFMS